MASMNEAVWNAGLKVVGPEGELRDQIVAAAIERHEAQQLLEKCARDGAPSWTMRQRQRAVNQADRRIAEAAVKLSETQAGLKEAMESVERGEFSDLPPLK